MYYPLQDSFVNNPPPPSSHVRTLMFKFLDLPLIMCEVHVFVSIFNHNILDSVQLDSTCQILLEISFVEICLNHYQIYQCCRQITVLSLCLQNCKWLFGASLITVVIALLTRVGKLDGLGNRSKRFRLTHLHCGN